MLLTEVSVRRPVFAIVISLLLVALGIMAATRLSIREYPAIEAAVVTVGINYRGASAEVIETKITNVVEQQLAGIEGLDKITSSSQDERSRITLEFTAGIDIESAANDVRDRVSRVQANLPPESEPPQVSKADARNDTALLVSIMSDKRSLSELTDYATRYFVNRFSVVPGVATVQIYGSQMIAMRVWLDRRAMASRALTVQDIEAALRNENVELPAGRLESSQRELTLRTDTGMHTEADFRALTVGRGTDGTLIRLGDIAEVNLGVENVRGLFKRDGRTSIALAVTPLSTANILDVASDANAIVKDIKSRLPDDMQMEVIADNSVFVRDSIHEVLITLAIALMLILLVIYAFLGSLRATLIPAVTIPISVVATCIVMAALGFSINMLTLLGIILAISLVVDDAIVVMENIVRRIQLGQPPLLAALDGSKEIAFAVIATTAVLIAVFLPISFIPGNLGRLFHEFGITVATAVFFSSLVALTLTPVMSAALFARGVPHGRVSAAIDRAFSWVSNHYKQSLHSAIGHAWLIALVCLSASVLAFWQLGRLPSEYAPTEDRESLAVEVTAPQGSSLEYTTRQMREIEEIINTELGRKTADRITLRIGGGGSTTSVTAGSIYIHVVPLGKGRTERAQQIATRLRAKLAQVAGVRISVTTPGGLGGRSSGQPVQFVLGGPSYEELVRWRDIVMDRARENPGLVNVNSNYDARKPELKVEIDRERAADLGVSLQTVGHTLETMLGARRVTSFVDRGEEYPVMLQARAEDRASPNDLDNIYVRQPLGGLVPLASVVKLREMAGPQTLNRFDRLRSITIGAELAEGYSLGDALSYLQGVVAQELPAEAQINYNGQSRDFMQAGSALYLTFLFAIGVVYLVLAAQFESFIHPAVIMTTVPLAIAGAVVGLSWQGGSINVFSQIGAVMLIGLAAKNGILIVEFANQLRDRGVAFVDAITQAAQTRLRPVLMTSLCSVFGAIPLLLASGAAAESRRPIGAVIVFGVTISMVLTLYVVPAVYVLMARNTGSPQRVAQLIARLRGSAQPG
ncbi:MAG: efflux RND transporter permease subunit [Steroidobacteraceae bacterium]